MIVTFTSNDIFNIFVSVPLGTATFADSPKCYGYILRLIGIGDSIIPHSAIEIIGTGAAHQHVVAVASI